MARLKAEAEATESKPRENPLVPHRRLREMYLAMAGTRLLAEWMTEHAGRGGVRGIGLRGQEACRAGVLIGLERGDLVLDPLAPFTSSYLLGADGSALAKARRAPRPVARARSKLVAQSAGTSEIALEDGRRGRRLVTGVYVEEALRLSLGVGLVLKSQAAERVLVVIVEGEAVRGETWKTVLTGAAEAETPVMFAILPGPGSKAGLLSARSTRLGVPGIAVDADDAVALLRVAQEAMVRMRMGGGPVLMECVRLGAARGKEAAPDCLEAMRSVVIAKGAADDAWIERAEAKMGGRLLARLDAGLAEAT